jgi:hypothetical protein
MNRKLIRVLVLVLCFAPLFFGCDNGTTNNPTDNPPANGGEDPGGEDPSDKDPGTDDDDKDVDETDHSGLYGVYVPGNSNYTSFGNVTLAETTITIKGTTHNITLGGDTPFDIYGQTLYIVYINYGSKKVGAIIAKPEPELFLGMSADAMVAWSFMGNAPAYIVEDDLGIFSGDKQK